MTSSPGTTPTAAHAPTHPSPLLLGADAIRTTAGEVVAWRESFSTTSPTQEETSRISGKAPGVLLRLTTDADAEGGPLGLAWLPRFRDAAIRAAGSLAEHATVPLILWPRAGDPLGDVPGVLTFLRSASPTWSFLLDPVGLLTPAMVPFAEDHFDRMFESLATHPSCWGVLLDDRGAGGTEAVAAALIARWNAPSNPALRAVRWDPQTQPPSR